jgi:hypothetical protein
MMTKRLKWIGYSISGVFVLTASLFTTWLLGYPSRVINNGEMFVREAFQPGKDMYPCIHEGTWATWYFAGTRGLPALTDLSQDASLCPYGRDLATNLYQYISTGRHLPTVRWELAHGQLPLLGRYYYRRLLRDDTVYLKEKGLPIPQGEEP